MIVGVDASNLRAGGGITHLTGLLEAADPSEHGITRVLVWSGARTLERLPTRAWLTLIHERSLDGRGASRALWQALELPRLAARSADVLFAPGGLLLRRFGPAVTMCRNMFPFEPRELARFGASTTTARLRFLRLAQLRSFRRADAVIFLTRYAKEVVERTAALDARKVRIIPHGVDERFRRAPHAPPSSDAFTPERPFRVLYVSAVSAYKHPWNVAAAVGLLRRKGLPITAELVGPAEEPWLDRLTRTIAREDPEGNFIRYTGPCPFEALSRKYREADAFVFASSCENMPNILLEAMAAGLPIACARRGPMPEVLADAGVYFDPEAPEDIAAALERLAASPLERARLAEKAHARAAAFTWARAARETFALLGEVGCADRARPDRRPEPSRVDGSSDRSRR